MNFNNFQIIIISSTLIYFLLDFLNKREVKDERHQLIELKTQALVSRCMSLALALVSLTTLLYPDLESIYLVLLLSLTFLNIFCSDLETSLPRNLLSV